MTPTSWLEINLARLDANVAAVRAVLGPNTKLCGVVKADAYGLGVVPIARRLTAHTSGAGGVDMLAVFSPEQAEQIASLSLSCPILVFMRMTEITRSGLLYRHATTGGLQPTIHDREQLAVLEHAGRMLGCQFPVHLYLDTGMARAGLDAEQFGVVLEDVVRMRHVRIAAVYTHLARAETDDGFSDQQIARLDGLLEKHRDRLPKDLIVHVANTAATLRDARYHRGMVRVGLGLFGYGGEFLEPFPFGRGQGEGISELIGATFPHTTPRHSESPHPRPLPKGEGARVRPIVRWLTRVIHVQEYPKGTPVGYGSTRVLTRDSVLGVVPVGYGDGYPRALSNHAVVGLPECTADGKPLHAAVLGRVNMDQTVVDLTDTPASLGSLVEMISDDPAAPHALHNLAELAGSNCHEMLCRLSPRVLRKYV